MLFYRGRSKKTQPSKAAKATGQISASRRVSARKQAAKPEVEEADDDDDESEEAYEEEDTDESVVEVEAPAKKKYLVTRGRPKQVPLLWLYCRNS